MVIDWTVSSNMDQPVEITVSPQNLTTKCVKTNLFMFREKSQFVCDQQVDLAESSSALELFPRWICFACTWATWRHIPETHRKSQQREGEIRFQTINMMFSLDQISRGVLQCVHSRSSVRLSCWLCLCEDNNMGKVTSWKQNAFV